MTIGTKSGNARTAGLLGLVVVAMFGFGFALIPLYDVLCEITGFGGRTGVAQAGELDGVVAEDRWVKVEFDGTVNSRLPWAFRPTVTSMRVHPGKVYETTYIARNLAGKATVGQAIPRVTPNVAASYFDKTECFCFSEQRFEPGEERAMPVRFVVRRDLPAEIETVTLSYIFFNSGEQS